MAAHPPELADHSAAACALLPSAALLDPVGWHYAELLSRRVATQHGQVQRLLQAKLAQALAALEARLAHAATAQAVPLSHLLPPDLPLAKPSLTGATTLASLQALTRCLSPAPALSQSATAGANAGVAVPGDASHMGAADTPLELKAMGQFKSTWAQLSVKKRLAQAQTQAPANAGPANSQHVVLQSMAQMQALSPTYVSRFTAYVDTLLYLDQLMPAKAAKPRRGKK